MTVRYKYPSFAGSSPALVAKLLNLTVYRSTEATTMEKFNQLEIALSEARDEAEKFYTKGNKAAGTRLRNKLQEIKLLATALRADVTNIKNADKA